MIDSTRRRRITSLLGFIVFQKHRLRVEEESAFFRQVSNRPLDGENVTSSKQTPSLPSASEGDDCTQVFLSFARGGPVHSWAPV